MLGLQEHMSFLCPGLAMWLISCLPLPNDPKSMLWIWNKETGIPLKNGRMCTPGCKFKSFRMWQILEFVPLSSRGEASQRGLSHVIMFTKLIIVIWEQCVKHPEQNIKEHKYLMAFNSKVSYINYYAKGSNVIYSQTTYAATWHSFFSWR